MKKYLLKRLLFLPLGLVAIIATAYAQYHPDWTEQVYSRAVYPVLSTVVGFLPSLAGFSVAEWLTLLFLLFCLGYIVFSVRLVVISKGARGMAAYRSVAGLAAIACTVYFLFTALCGLNYHRYPFSYYTGYAVQPSSVPELEQLCTTLADELGQAREPLGDDTDLSAPGPGDFSTYAQHAVSAMQRLAEPYPALERPLYSTPKPMVFSGLMSHADIGGIFFPFTVESNINADMPFFTQPSTMAHELAHQCGFMREDEANFIAYLACRQSDAPLMRYSGLFLAFSHAINALAKADYDRAVAIVAGLPPAVQRDRAQHRQFWAQYEGPISSFSNAVNDSYLKANNQADGVSSYGRMVDLLLAEQRATT